MKKIYLIILTISICNNIAAQRDEKHLIQGDWILSKIKNIPFYSKDTTFQFSNVLNDSALYMKIQNNQIQIISTSISFIRKDTTNFSFTISKDTLKRTLLNLELNEKSTHKKKYVKYNKQPPIEIIKINSSSLLIEKPEFEFTSPFFKYTRTQYLFSKVNNDTIITENNFIGNWWFCPNEKCKLESDTLHLQKVKCEENNDVQHGFYFSTNWKSRELYNCYSRGTILSTPGSAWPWYLDPINKELILITKNDPIIYRYVFNESGLMLIKK